MSSRRQFGYIRKLKSGRHQASYKGTDGARHNAPYTFQTKKDANTWLSQQETLLHTGSWTDPRAAEIRAAIPQRFEEYAKRHIEIQTNHKGELLRANTKDLYQRLLRTKLSQFHKLPLVNIDTAMISEWWAIETATGKRTSASKAYKLLSAVLKRAVEEKLIHNNPCTVKGAQSAVTGKPLVTPDTDQVAAIAAAINPRYREYVILAAYAGLRFSEMTELRKKDFYKVPRVNATGEAVEGYEIRVSRAVTLVGNEHIVDRPKSSAGTRTVEVTSALAAMIDELLERAGKDPEALIFPSANSTYLRHDVFTNSWRRALKRSGNDIPGLTPHMLRHYAGSYLSRAGANLPELKEWLGDKSTEAVTRYLHTTKRAPQLVELMELGL